MKRLIALLAFLAASAALAAETEAWMHVPSHQVSWFRPSSCTIDGRAYAPPTDEQLAEAGYLAVWFDDVYGSLRYRVVSWEPPSIRAFTPEEKAAADQADADAAAQAEYEASLPVPMPTGVEVPWVVFLDSTNRQKGVAMELTEAGDQIFYVFHASPVDFALVRSNRAAAHARLAARKEAVENVKRKGASANSVPALREAFSNLCVELNRPWIIPGL